MTQDELKMNILTLRQSGKIKFKWWFAPAMIFAKMIGSEALQLITVKNGVVFNAKNPFPQRS